MLWQPSAADEPSWDTMWGPGRPGWHIECSALALRELGTTIDLHGGGTDLIFPHHECERAQSEAATGEPFVRHWMHTGLIAKDGEKMSKSLGNLVFVDALRKEWEPMAIRLGIIEHHYRTEWEWDDELMPRSARRLEAWRAAAGGRSGDVLTAVREALDDDLDTPAAFAAIDAAAARGEDVGAAAALLGVAAVADTRRRPVHRTADLDARSPVTRTAYDVGPWGQPAGAGKAQRRTRRVLGPVTKPALAHRHDGLRAPARPTARPSCARTTSRSSTRRS